MVKKCNIWMNWCCHFHTDTHVLTSHVGKLMKLLFFQVGNIATSEIQITFWMCFYPCNIIRTTWDTEKKNELQEYRFSNILGKRHQFFGSTLSPLCHFLLLLCQPLPSLLSDLLFASFKFASVAFEAHTVVLLVF